MYFSLSFDYILIIHATHSSHYWWVLAREVANTELIFDHL